MTLTMLMTRERNSFKPIDERQRLLAAMGLDNAHHRVDAFLPPPMSGLQHGIRLPDPSRSTEEDFQPAALLLLLVALDLVEQFVWVRAIHQLAGFNSSSARFSFSTFTRASPRMPNWRPLVAR